jgi:two-component system, chemotaxis family, chemotaxis protein CheY
MILANDMRVLIVDDNRVMRNLVKRSLYQGGFDNLEIIEASDGQEAFEKFKEILPDLVLSDWNMPKMDGLELLQAIRLKNPTVLFGFITAQNTSTLRKNAQDFGAHFLLSKPFKPEKLTKAIQSILP